VLLGTLRLLETKTCKPTEELGGGYRVKRTRCEVDQCPPSTAEAKNERSYTSIPLLTLYASVAWTAITSPVT
jgi:hypothetical protein